jgi:hypothetical protein
MVKWIGKVRGKFDVWWNRWHGQDQSVHPALYFRESNGNNIICDSRSGGMIEYQIKDTTKQVLEHLDRPRKLASLANSLSHIPNLDLGKEIYFLRERGLIFEEGKQGMSLVLPKEPVQLTLLSTEVGHLPQKLHQ